MKLSKGTTNRRITIPASNSERSRRIWNKYGFHSGRKVKFEIENGGRRIYPLFTPEEIKANAGFQGNGSFKKSFIYFVTNLFLR